MMYHNTNICTIHYVKGITLLRICVTLCVCTQDILIINTHIRTLCMTHGS